MCSSDICNGSTTGFASQLRLLVKALEMSPEAKFIEDFVSGWNAFIHILMYQMWIINGECHISYWEIWLCSFLFSPNLDFSDVYCCILSFNLAVENAGSENLNPSAVVPPPTVLDRVLKDLFHEGTKSCLLQNIQCNFIV